MIGLYFFRFFYISNIEGFLGNERIEERRNVAGNQKQGYYERFKSKEVESRRRQNRSLTRTSSHGYYSNKSRNETHRQRVKTNLSERKLTANDITQAYGTRVTSRESRIDVENSKTIRNGPFTNLRFNLGRINPIIRHINSRLSSSSAKPYENR